MTEVVCDTCDREVDKRVPYREHPLDEVLWLCVDCYRDFTGAAERERP